MGDNGIPYVTEKIHNEKRQENRHSFPERLYKFAHDMYLRVLVAPVLACEVKRESSFAQVINPKDRQT